MKRINWVLVILVLIGFVIGRFIGTYFDGTFLNYGQSFGLSSPIELNMGFVILTFGLQFHITIASVIGVIIAFVVYALLINKKCSLKEISLKRELLAKEKKERELS